MDINITLLGEMLTFAVLIFVTAKYIWPPIIKTMQDRQQKIAEGLDAARRAQEELISAKKTVEAQLQSVKAEAGVLLGQATKHADKIIEEGKKKAQEEYRKILNQTKTDIAYEIAKKKLELQTKIADLVIITTEKILRQKIDETAKQKLNDQLIDEILK